MWLNIIEPRVFLVQKNRDGRIRTLDQYTEWIAKLTYLLHTILFFSFTWQAFLN